MLKLEGQASSDPDESWEANQIKSNLGREVQEYAGNSGGCSSKKSLTAKILPFSRAQQPLKWTRKVDHHPWDRTYT